MRHKSCSSHLYQGEQRTFAEVIAKFAQLTPQERVKRKLESLETLRKTFKKLDHDVKVEDFLGSSCWSDQGIIGNVEHLRQMEDLLRESITRIRLQKENVGKLQLTSLACTAQNRMPLSMIVGGVQETHSLSWLPNDDNQCVMRPSEPNFLPLRYVECSSDVLFPGYSGHFSTDNSVEVTKVNSGGGSVDELSRTACLNVKFGEQYAYPLYSSSDLLDDKKLMPEMEMNSLENPVDFQVYSNFEPPRSLCDSGHQTWFSSSGPCAIAIYNQNAYQQQPN